MSDLPQWRQDADGAWECDDRDEMNFAWKAALLGFDLVVFDRWLAELEPCGLRDRMMVTRRNAKARQQPDEMRPYFEAMYFACLFARREDALLPLAQTGDKTIKRLAAGGAKTAAERKATKTTRDEALRNAARAIKRTDPGIKIVALAAILADRGHGAASTIERKLPALLRAKLSTDGR